MKRITALFLMLLLLVSLFGCATEEKPYIPTGDALDDWEGSTVAPPAQQEQQLTLAYYPNRSMNPFTCNDSTNRAIFPLLYQSLFSINRNYEVIPILCDRYSVTPDMRTYTIYLAAATFSDGSLLTPEDVAASLLAAKSGSYYAGRFTHFTGITATADAVVITLDTPMSDLPMLLDIPIVPASQVDAENPIGTGPYVLDTTLGGKQLRRSSLWWCQSDLIVTAAYIPLIEGTSPSQIRDQFEFADLGLVCADPGSDTYADYRCDYELWDIENGIFLYLGFNFNSPVFSIEEIRSAVTYAIDRDYLVESFYRGFARSATLPASPQSPYYNATLAERYRHGSNALHEALKANNLIEGHVTLLLNSDDSLRLRAGRAIAEMLRASGLVVTVEEVSTSVFKWWIQAGEYDLYLGQTRLSANMDLSPFFAKNGSLNFGGMAETTAYAMCLEALANEGNYYNLHKEVMDRGLLCPILFRSYAIYATRGLVTQLNPARDNMFYYSIGRTLADAKIKP